MKKIGLVILFSFSLVVFSIDISFSQDTNRINYNCLADKKWSLVFEVGTIFGGNYGSNYKSFLLTGKYHLDKSNAVRLFIGTYGNKSDGEVSGISSYSNMIENSTKNFDLEGGLQYVRYLNADSKVKVYFCFGPYVKYNYHYSYGEEMNVYEYDERIDDTWGIGCSASLGAEYFILDNISLVGEYSANGTIGKSQSTFNYLSVNGFHYVRIDTDKSEFEFNKMRLGFSVYF